MSELSTIIEFLKNVNELKVAKELLDTFKKYSTSMQQYDELAKCYCDIKKYKESIEVAEKCLAITSNPQELYTIRANLAKVYNHNNEPDKALLYLNINNSLIPDEHENLLEQVFSLFLLNRKEESEALLRRLLTFNGLEEEIYNRVLFNLGTYDLYKGKFQEGLRGFLLVGKKLNIWKNIQLPFPFWEGGIRFGKKLIIVAEGGIGDEFINLRFLKNLTDLGMEPIWYTTRKDICDIIEYLGYNYINDLNDLDKSEDYLWTYSMSLPIYLDLQPEDLWKGKYLYASNLSINRWHYSLPDNNKLNVGIKWSGNPDYEQDLHRSLNLDDLYNVLFNFDCNLISLQRDDNLECLKDYPDIMDTSKKLEDYDSTLGLIENLDIIITSCTSIAHAAAAMDKKVYILVPITAYYTWASTTDTSSIWYGSNTKVLRQVTHKSWKEPLEELTRLLQEEIIK